ncbi:uncharacterized protein LOC113272874 [Papaver somniferum]|uniref:uncharacterized protein LOC113272874 n=1 Tax=Papaver somniferum TaxID=3469 RepID=UPI000E6F9EC9|nr:uncharacterized protein LOC113272874 [Papaver somniferum]
MNEFRSWISDNGLVEADSIGEKYTWCNCQSGDRRIVSRNDRAIVNDAWSYKYENWRCKALPRICSDHSLLFGFAFDSPRLARAPFRIQKMWFDHPGFMQLVEDNWNLRLVGAPPFVFAGKLKHLKEVLKLWNRTVFADVQFLLKQAELSLESENDLLDLDPSDEVQFTKVADAKNVVDAVRTDFADEIKDFIVNHYKDKFNGGAVVIDPKLFEFEHERISDHESSFMDVVPTLDEIKRAVFDLGEDSTPSPDGFSGKNIHENIALASELINDISTSRNFGNVGLILDISQAFDTVSWEFITEFFCQYGFSETWCSWIHSILSSARISVLINGSPEGFFSITRGLRQGDPISPLIFVLIEDILSRNLSKLFANRSMHNMVSKKGVDPTHLLFADDILVFCRGNLYSLQNLKTMLSVYEKASGQCVNYAKSKFYYGGGSYSRSISIDNYLGMERALFPDKYLGIQLKPGIVRHIHVRQVVEKIMDKLAGWKGKLLSFQARLVLIRSVIASYVIHSMVVYKWPCNIIKQVERAIRNFLWSGDAEKRKFFTVLYDNLCCSRREGGLGLRRLVDVNKAMLMKLWISIRDSDKTWARFLRAKYFKLNGVLIDYKLGSTVFPGIRWVYDFVQQHTRSIIGDCANTSLFFDNWLGDFSIAKRLGITSKGPNDFKAKVSDIIIDGAWAIPQSTRDLMVQLNIDVGNLHIIASGDDYKIWDLDSKGVFSVKSAKAAIRENAETLPTANLFSRPVVHPTLSVQHWKIWEKQCCASDDNVIKKTGRFAKRIWAWAARIFNLHPRKDLVASYKAVKGCNMMIKDLWLVANLAITTELWRLRNKVYFEDVVAHWLGFKGRVYQLIRDNSMRMKGHMNNTMEDLRILNYFKVKHRSCKVSSPIEVRWCPPNQDEIMICCDGASLGNPGPTGAGVTFRDANAVVLGVLCVGLGLQTNFYAEVCAVIYSAMLARRWNFRSICVQSDSMSCIQAFQNEGLPWQLNQKWRLARSFYSNIRYIHKYREVNFFVDASAKQACLLDEYIFEFYKGRPISMLSVEWPDKIYFRFK